MSRRDLVAVLILVAASVAVARLGAWYGENFVARGPGYPTPPAVTRDFFRFDSLYYLDIATHGYAYDGQPYSSPNIVFAPAFPLLVKFLAFGDPVAAGFVINFVLFVAAVALLWRVLAREFGERVAFFALLAQVTCEGSYAFHAYYAESTMLFALAAVLYARQSRRWGTLAVAAAGLGAARVTALPVVGLVAVEVLARRRDLGVVRAVGLAALSLSGVAGYLGYLALRFGNPFALLPEIQSASWGLFHPPTDWVKVLTGTYLVEHVVAALAHAPDIRTINLAWTLLALASIVPLARRPAARGFTALFAGYALFVYAFDASSEILISAHRFFALMTPIFVVGALGCARLPRGPARALGASLLALNAGLAIWHAGCFNQGTWFYF